MATRVVVLRPIVIDPQYRVAKAREEEEERHVEETRYCVCDNRHVPSFRSLVQVLPKPGVFQSITVPLEDMHIITHPLLDEGGEERRGETEDEGNEPEDIDADIGC